eukprot:7378416-Prymnesium_polylepis.1
MSLCCQIRVGLVNQLAIRVQLLTKKDHGSLRVLRSAASPTWALVEALVALHQEVLLHLDAVAALAQSLESG